MLVVMNAIYEHPSLSMHVTPDQRDRAESWLKDAYADGRISEPEFDRRNVKITGRGVAAVAHFSVFFLWLFGPGLVYALSTPQTYARREAAKSFNFQLISSIAFVLVAILGGITNLDIFGWLLPFMGLGWFILTIVGGAKALQGDDWRNPVKSVVKLEVLSEK